MSKNLDHLFETRRWVYWLDICNPGTTEGTYRVSIVFENEPGHYPTGGGDKEPWYWTEACCQKKNADRGFSEEDVDNIVTSSMFHRSF